MAAIRGIYFTDEIYAKLKRCENVSQLVNRLVFNHFKLIEDKEKNDKAVGLSADELLNDVEHQEKLQYNEKAELDARKVRIKLAITPLIIAEINRIPTDQELEEYTCRFLSGQEKDLNVIAFCDELKLRDLDSSGDIITADKLDEALEELKEDKPVDE